MIPTIASIQRAVAREYRVPLRTMRQPAPRGQCGTNADQVSHPRQAAMALAVLLTEHSYPRIGQFFGGRDPTTVRHASKVVARRRRSDARLHETMRRVTLELVMRRG